MLLYNNGQHCQIAGNSCGYFTDSSYLVTQVSHNYRLETERSVLWHQGEIRGYGKKVMNRDNPQPSPKDCIIYGCSSETQCQWATEKWLKIESIPTEMWSLRGTPSICCYIWWESLRSCIIQQRKACSLTPTKHIVWLLLYFIYN